MDVLKLDESKVPALREIAARHHLTYRVDPAVEMDGPRRVVVGYDVDLVGAHPPHTVVLPGCSQCEILWDELERIAAALRERLEGRVSVTRESPFRRALTSSNWPDGTPCDEVRLTLCIRHRSGCFEPIDDSESECLSGIIGALKYLGARPEGAPLEAH